MQHALLDVDRTSDAPEDYLGANLGANARIFARFGPETQDSGNLSYGVEVDQARFFVKTTDPDADVLLDHSSRVQLLRNATKIAARCQHSVLPQLLNVIESATGPMLIYQWVEGELLRARPGDSDSAHERFRALDVDIIVRMLERVVSLHTALRKDDYVAVDFYDGCLIYDFSAAQLHVVDLDNYEQGAFFNSMGRMFGSSRFMAPEEFEYGAKIDERSSLFNLGRMMAIFLSDGTLQRVPFRGSSALHEVMVRACEPRPADRYPSMVEFHAAWTDAR